VCVHTYMLSYTHSCIHTCIQVPKPPRPPGCHRGYHATILGCGDGYGASMLPARGFEGNFWATGSALAVLPDFSTLGDAQWTDKPHTIMYSTDTFAAIADDFPADKFAAQWTVRDSPPPTHPSTACASTHVHKCAAKPLPARVRAEGNCVMTVLCVAGFHLHQDPRCLRVLRRLR